MILEIIRNVLASNLVFSDCLQAYSIFSPVEKSLSLKIQKMAVFRASSVLLLLLLLLLHDIPFQMQITTADQPLTNR